MVSRLSMPIVNERYHELRSLTHGIARIVLHFDRNILVRMVLRVVRERVVVLLWTLVHGGVYGYLHLNRLQGGNKKKIVTRIRGNSYRQRRDAWMGGKTVTILAENGGLEVALEPDGVFGIWNAGACRLNDKFGPGPWWLALEGILL